MRISFSDAVYKQATADYRRRLARGGYVIGAARSDSLCGGYRTASDRYAVLKTTDMVSAALTDSSGVAPGRQVLLEAAAAFYGLRNWDTLCGLMPNPAPPPSGTAVIRLGQAEFRDGCLYRAGQNTVLRLRDKRDLASFLVASQDMICNVLPETGSSAVRTLIFRYEAEVRQGGTHRDTICDQLSAALLIETVAACGDWGARPPGAELIGYFLKEGRRVNSAGHLPYDERETSELVVYCPDDVTAGVKSVFRVLGAVFPRSRADICVSGDYTDVIQHGIRLRLTTAALPKQAADGLSDLLERTGSRLRDGDNDGFVEIGGSRYRISRSTGGDIPSTTWRTLPGGQPGMKSLGLAP